MPEITPYADNSAEAMLRVISLFIIGDGEVKDEEMERHKIESQDMASAIWARIGVVPLLLAVMVTIMLESGALYQAGRGELPDALVARCPPPEGLVGSETEPPAA